MSTQVKTNFYSGNGQSKDGGYRRPAGGQATPNYRNFFGPGQFKFDVFPDDNWNVKKWGPKPWLGEVWADDEFYAVREAYTKNLAPVNFTFGLVAVKQRFQK